MASGYLSPGARKEKLRQRSFQPPRSRRSSRPWVELHARSAFSFLEGASLPEDLIARAADLGLPAMALVDRDVVAGAPRFFSAARAAGVRALVGVEVSLQRPFPGLDRSRDQPPARLTLLARNQRGYRNLCRLLSDAALAHPKGEPRATWKGLEAHGEGLQVLTGGDEGPVAALLADGRHDRVPDLLDRLTGMFPGRVAVELQRHGVRQEEYRNQLLVPLARRLGLPLVATGGCRYDLPERRDLADVVTAIRHKTTLDRAGQLLDATRARHLHSAAEMERLFDDLPEAVSGAAELAEELDFTLADLGYRFPECALPPGETPSSHLRHLTWSHARSRFRPLTAKAQQQLEHELNVIEKLDLAGYFLVVHDIVRFCREEGILTQGRGSAANSAVCYALGITAVDPVRMELLFERFLSEERGEWPDIDLDLPSGDQRERVIQHLYSTYGQRGCAMTANVITYRGRSAAREVGKVLGYAGDQLDALSRQLGRFGHDLGLGREGLRAELLEAGFDLDEDRVGHLARLWIEIQNLPRHLGQHSGGMIVAAGRLDEVVPIGPAGMPSRTIVQWDKDDCADLGIIKVDLLGLGMLAALEEAIPMIRTHEGVDVDLAHLPEDDPDVYAMLRAADTVGVFQVESRAQMASLPRNSPERFYDLVVQVAIIRPGPIQGGLVHPYFDRRRGRAEVDCIHPILEPILRRTLGVPIFQEQVLKMAMVAAGFSGGEAEQVRRAMGFKRSEERMEEIEARLRRGMAERSIHGSAQDQIVRSITSFAMYGFPESHAASFALIAYSSAYLKFHHPTAFYASLLNAWPMGFYHPSTLIQDAMRRGVEVRPIDITRSGWFCRWEDDAVRLGLRFVSGLRRKVGDAIESAAAERPFTDLRDVVRRSGAGGPEMDALAAIGALSAFDRSRRGALWQVARLSRSPGPLFDDEPDPSASPLAEMSRVEETLADYDVTGVTAGPHVLHHLRPQLTAQGLITCAEVARRRHGSSVRTAGLVIVRQRPMTAKGVIFLTIEDESGMVQAIVHPPAWEQHHKTVVGHHGLIIEGRIQKLDGTLSIIATDFAPLNASVEVHSHDFH